MWLCYCANYLWIKDSRMIYCWKLPATGRSDSKSPFTVLTVDSLLGRIFRNLTEGREPFKVEPRTSCISGRIGNNKINVLYSLSEGQWEYTWMVVLSCFPKISCFPPFLLNKVFYVSYTLENENKWKPLMCH